MDASIGDVLARYDSVLSFSRNLRRVRHLPRFDVVLRFDAGKILDYHYSSYAADVHIYTRSKLANALEAYRLG